jgi:hypothetical protein
MTIVLEVTLSSIKLSHILSHPLIVLEVTLSSIELSHILSHPLHTCE